jgi:hypothetical protein
MAGVEGAKGAMAGGHARAKTLGAAGAQGRRCARLLPPREKERKKKSNRAVLEEIIGDLLEHLPQYSLKKQYW